MGIKDYCYASLVAKEDLPSLYRLAQEIRLTHNQDLIDDFNNKCEQAWNDHPNNFLNVSKADDLILTVGINQCIDQILGVSTTRWRYMRWNNSSTAPLITDTTLGGESGGFSKLACDMSLFGWREFAGTTLKFGAIFGESVASDNIRECGISTVSIVGSGVLLNHNVFSANSITHTINVTGFVLTGIIEFVPMM